MQSTDSELVLLFFDRCLSCKCSCALLHVNKYVKHVLEAGGRRIKSLFCLLYVPPPRQNTVHTAVLKKTILDPSLHLGRHQKLMWVWRKSVQYSIFFYFFVILLTKQTTNRHCRKHKPVIRLILQAGSGM